MTATKTSFPVAVISDLLTLVLLALVGGWTLMLLVPLVAKTFALPLGHPGYWPCVLLVGLARLTYRSVSGSTASSVTKWAAQR